MFHSSAFGRQNRRPSLALLLVASSSLAHVSAQTIYFGQEPNQSKAEATLVDGFQSGDVITTSFPFPS